MIKSRRYPKKTKRKTRRTKITKGGVGDVKVMYTLEYIAPPDVTQVVNDFPSNNNEINATSSGDVKTFTFVVKKYDIPLYNIVFNEQNQKQKDIVLSNWEGIKEKQEFINIPYFNKFPTGRIFTLNPIPQSKKSILSISISSDPVINNFINVISNIYLTKEEVDVEYKSNNLQIMNTDPCGNIIGTKTENFEQLFIYNGIKYHKVLTSTSIVTLTPAYFTINNNNKIYYFCRRNQFWSDSWSSRSGSISAGYKIQMKNGISRLTDNAFLKRVSKYYNDINQTHILPAYNTTNWIK